MPEPKPDDKKELLEFLKNFWAHIAGFIGAVTLAYNFYQLWLGDLATVTWFFVISGLLLLTIALGWIALSAKTTTRKALWPIGATITETNPRFEPRQRKNAWIGLGVIGLLAIGGFVGLIFQQQALAKARAELEEKLIVVIATFDGPEEVYGLRNEIFESLNKDFASDENIIILPIDDVITPALGSTHARQLGEERLADVVIWGWYRPTENPNVTIHIENLSPAQLIPLKSQEIYQPQAMLADLESFTFQQQAGRETSALIAFLAGFIEYQAENYQEALVRFTRALDSLHDTSQIFTNLAEIYFYCANAYYYLENYESAIRYFDQLIQLDLQWARAYNNRGNAYRNLKQYERAIQDYDKAIQLDPQDASAYNNRGLAYFNLEQYERAIQNFDQGIRINPQDANSLILRGLAYALQEDQLRAIQDFDQAIQLDPQRAIAYYNRGLAYFDLEQYERAIQDYDQAIQFDPEYVDVYNNRGFVYLTLREYERAIQDFDQAIQLDPQYAGAYNNRGLTYNYLGDYERAIQNFDQAIQLDPQYADALILRGLAYALQEDHLSAIQDFDQVILINPRLADAYYLRGLAYQELGEPSKAESDFAKYKELTGQDAP